MSAATKSLSEALRDKYRELRGTPLRVTHKEIADAIDVVDAYVSQLHRGRADVAVVKWPGPQAYAFLRAHRMSREEVQQFAKEYDLQNVLDYMDLLFNSGHPARVREGEFKVRFYGYLSQGDVAFVDSNENGVATVDIPELLLGTHRATDVLALDIAPESLMCPYVLPKFGPGTRCYFSTAKKPQSDDIVLATLPDGRGVMIPNKPMEYRTLVSADGSQRPLVLDDDEGLDKRATLIGYVATA